MKTSPRSLVSLFWSCAALLLALAVATSPAALAGPPAPPESFAHGAAPELLQLEKDSVRLEKAIRANPDDRELLARLGQAYRALGEATADPEKLGRAAEAFIRAADLALEEGRVLYTREISELLVERRDLDGLYEVFQRLLAFPPTRDPGGHYLALVDFADGLAHLGDETAWGTFELALDSGAGTRREAVQRYAQHLLDRGRDQEALELLEGRLSREERLRFFLPAFLRREARERLGLDTSDADEEVQLLRTRAAGAMGMAAGEDGSGGLVSIHAPMFSHSSSGDDCRNPAVSTNCTPDGAGNCFYTVSINLAEILWNEARGERIGAQDMVGWTVRDRAFQSLSCDSYPGAQGNGLGNSCRAVVPCSDPNFCAESRRYCCVMHGGTTSVGATHSQFNDGHTSFSNLVSSGLIYEAVYILNGWVPELSTNFVPPGVTSCNFGCDNAFCFFGSNVTSPSPQGPHEFRGNNYCALAQSCKTYVKNVCGQNAAPASCSTGGNSGDNHFWNRK